MKNRQLSFFRFFAFSMAVLASSPALFSQNRLEEPTPIPVRKGEKWGYANAEKVILIEPKFDSVGIFCERLAWVKKGNRFAFLTSLGQFITDFEFKKAEHFGYGFAHVTDKKGERFCIDNSGEKTACLGVCGGSINFTQFFETYDLNGKKGILKNWSWDREARKMVGDSLPARYDFFREDFHGLSVVAVGKKWGIIDHEEHFVLPLEYEKIDFNKYGGYWGNGREFTIWKNGLAGYADEKGQILIEPKYEKAEFFWRGLAFVRPKKGRGGFIDRRGTEFWED